MLVKTEKEYCDRCGAEIPKCRYDGITRWLPLYTRVGYVKIFSCPWRWNKEIHELIRDETTYKILCMNCAKEFCEWWEKKNND